MVRFMSEPQRLTEYDGLPVVEFGRDSWAPPPREAAWLVRVDDEGEPFDRFLETVDTTAVTHIIIGCWGPGYQTSTAGVRMLADAAPRLPVLRAIVLGDITTEEDEISGPSGCDITPLLGAYPGLESLGVRGGSELRLSPFSSPALRALRLGSGALPGAVVRAVGASELASLEILELRLGVEAHGGNVTVRDLAGILGGERLPALRRLGLIDNEIKDQICAAVATAPVVARLSELVLSGGVLTDRGAEALLSGQPLTQLRLLDLRYHFLSPPMAGRLRASLPQVQVELGPSMDDPDIL
jgi:hypothetical protein